MLGDYMGPVPLLGDEKIALSAAAGFSALLLAILLAQAFVLDTPWLRRYPGSMIGPKSIFDFILSIAVTVNPLMTQTTLLNEKDCQGTTAVKSLAACVELGMLGSELWFLAMGRDLYETTINPFSSFKSRQKQNWIWTSALATFMAVLLYCESDLRHVGITWYYMPWLVDPCVYESFGQCFNQTFAPNAQYIECTKSGMNRTRFAFMYAWIIVIYTYCFFVFFYARRRLIRGIPSSLENRRGMIRRSALGLGAMVLFWVIPLGLLLWDWSISQGMSASADDDDVIEADKQQGRNLGFAFAMFISFRGTYMFIIVNLIYRDDICRSGGQTQADMDPSEEEEEDEQDTQTVLRKELLYHSTLCIRFACYQELSRRSTGTSSLASRSSMRRGSSDRGVMKINKVPDNFTPENISLASPSRVRSRSNPDRMEDREFTGPFRRSFASEVEVKVNPLIQGSQGVIPPEETPPDASPAASSTQGSKSRSGARDSLRESMARDLGRQLQNLDSFEGLDLEESTSSGGSRLNPRTNRGGSEVEMQASASNLTATKRHVQINKADSQNARAITDIHREASIDALREDDLTCISGCLEFFKSIFRVLLPSSDTLRFTTHEPHTFAEVRRIDEISADDYFASWENTCRESFSEGASGAFLFFSKDLKYIVKTCTPGEMSALRDIADDYLVHLQNHPGTRLTKIYGAHTMEIYGREIHFIVMNNLFLGQEVNRRYDLKGSWVNRSAGASPSENAVLKDSDLHEKFQIPADFGFQLAVDLDEDARFLCSKGLMDYSLLVGVSLGTAGSTPPPDVQADNQAGRSVIPAAVIQGPQQFYIGIIDILQEWNWDKRMESWAKQLFKCADPHGISAVHHDEYYRRFMERAVCKNFVGADQFNANSEVSRHRPSQIRDSV